MFNNNNNKIRVQTNTESVQCSGGSRKNIWGPGPSSFGRQQRLSEITIEPIKIWGAG